MFNLVEEGGAIALKKNPDKTGKAMVKEYEKPVISEVRRFDHPLLSLLLHSPTDVFIFRSYIQNPPS